MKPNTEFAKTAFRYSGGYAAMFILTSYKLSLLRKQKKIKPSEKDLSSIKALYFQKVKNLFFLFPVSKKIKTKNGY